ncbi:hypothetical protein EJ04DRAFT_391778, partial [Polyplosphaeria fusca]
IAAMEAALEALQSLKLGESPNYTKTAKEYGVSRSALSRRHRGVAGSRTQQYCSQQLLD